MSKDLSLYNNLGCLLSLFGACYCYWRRYDDLHINNSGGNFVASFEWGIPSQKIEQYPTPLCRGSCTPIIIYTSCIICKRHALYAKDMHHMQKTLSLRRINNKERGHPCSIQINHEFCYLQLSLYNN